MSAIELKGVTKRFGDVVAVNTISFELAEGQLLTLLGPSGCGKSTTLRLLAGFEEADEGDIILNGQKINQTPPERRPMAMVFQSYALWPHKTVFGNVAFGLRVLGKPKADIAAKVAGVLKLVGLDGLAERYPRQLSGGQRQRVALARALAVEPRVLLLDEPLSNLDAKLRIRMRGEIRSLQQQLGITMIYVTHDQEEALSISDCIVVMNQGNIEQIAPPVDIYSRPDTLFVASFMGQTNFLQGTVQQIDGEQVTVQIGAVDVTARISDRFEVGESCVVAIKTEEIKLVDEQRSNSLPATFQKASYMGSTTRWEVEAAGQPLLMDVTGHHQLEHGDQLHILLPPEELLAFRPDAVEKQPIGDAHGTAG